MSCHENEIAAEDEAEALVPVSDLIAMLLEHVSDDLDHPELWPDMAVFAEAYPGLADALAVGGGDAAVLRAVALGLAGERDAAWRVIEPVAVARSQSALVQGAAYFLQGLEDGTEAYDLSAHLCPAPFDQLDVLDGSAHQCCASWLRDSAGDLGVTPWRAVWNSDAAQAIRASIHDGSYRHCNKTACPVIQARALPTKAEVAARSTQWRDMVENERVVLASGPARVNLAYDRTCNLSCPSCRAEKWAADGTTRARFDALQEQAILPMLREARVVSITGSGDPFASKNFRRLMTRLDAEAYPDLKFRVMTNAMLFNAREWEAFPALHGRTAVLRISTDAASGPTHEALRRGARWSVMLENMAFAAKLRTEGLVDSLEFAFTVQDANFAEMGDAVDLANAHGADLMRFYRVTNWGTYSEAEFAAKAVFMPGHPRHEAFLAMLQDARLGDRIVRLADLSVFRVDCEEHVRLTDNE